MKPVLRSFLVSMAILSTPILAHSQIFTDAGPLGVLPTGLNSSEFGDLDNDGDYDLVITGIDANNLPDTYVYLNQGGTFTIFNAGLANFGAASLDLADYDNDGDLDIAFHDAAKIYMYRNDNLIFTLVDPNLNFHPQASAQLSFIKWIDLNGDGVLELVAAGDPDKNGSLAAVYTFKDGGYVPLTHNIPNGRWPAIDPADFNRDGLVDLLIKTEEGVGIYINKGQFQFDNTFNQSIAFSAAHVGDFNNDGYDDFIFSAKKNGTEFSTQIFLNSKNDSFEPAAVSLPGIFLGQLEVADFNMDGLDDFFLNGSLRTSADNDETETYMSKLFLNSGNMNFAVDNSTFTECKFGDTDVVDINGDLKPDLFISGLDHYVVTGNVGERKMFSSFHLNVSASTNLAPEAPVINDYELFRDMVRLTWDAPGDDKSTHLKYNVRVGTLPDGFDVLNPFTRGDHPLTYTTYTTGNSFKVSSLKNLGNYGKIYASVQAIDNSFNHGPYSAPVEIMVVPQADFKVANDSICTGQDLEVFFEGLALGNATFQWTINNVPFTPIDNEHFNIQFDQAGLKTIKLLLESNGQSATTSINVLVMPSAKLDFAANLTSCFQEEYKIEYTGDLDASIRYEPSPLGAGYYSVISSENGSYIKWRYPGANQVNFSVEYGKCLTSGTVTVAVAPDFSRPEICLVTSDPETSKNVVTWSYEADWFSGYGIYRETGQANKYELIGTVMSTNTHNSFLDTQSQPGQQAYRYRIAVIDTCGSSTLGEPHKTIHLTVNKGQGESWNLLWNRYEGKGISYSSYRIYRAVDEEELKLLAEVAGNLNSFTDLNPPSQNVVYQIEIVTSRNCDDGQDDPGGRVKKTFNTSRSNIARTVEVVGVEEDLQLFVSMYPNPTTSDITIRSNVQRTLTLRLYDVMGKEYLHQDLAPLNESTLPLRNLRPGIYFLQMKDKDRIFTKKVIKQ